MVFETKCPDVHALVEAVKAKVGRECTIPSSTGDIPARLLSYNLTVSIFFLEVSFVMDLDGTRVLKTERDNSEGSFLAAEKIDEISATIDEHRPAVSDISGRSTYQISSEVGAVEDCGVSAPNFDLSLGPTSIEGIYPSRSVTKVEFNTSVFRMEDPFKNL